jgi:hypothetical protein
MMSYLRKKGRKFYCSMTGGLCPIVKTIKDAEDFEGCAPSCDRPIEKYEEDRAERMSFALPEPDY